MTDNIYISLLIMCLTVYMIRLLPLLFLRKPITNRFIGILVAVSMAVSWIFSVLPLTKGISSGFKVIILTLLIAGAAAAINPVEEEPQENT